MLSAAAALCAAAPAAAGSAPRTEVVVTLDAPPLAYATARSRVLTRAASSRRLDLRNPTSLAYLRSLASEQRRLQSRITSTIPGAVVRWHYSIVLNGLAVDLPSGEVGRLRSLPGVAHVYPSVRYRTLGRAAASLDQTPELIGAPELWGPTLATAGDGIKIGIIDDGVDQSHPFLAPSGFSMPPGFPKGNRSYTSAKVIAARAFPPPSPHYANAKLPFDPNLSEHGTWVAGIAAGDHGVSAFGDPLSGIAPNAYIGNYKALSIPTGGGVGPDGNNPEIARAIEAAVRDGMDVINLSLGEPEIEPSRDIAVKAINGAAAAGVVPTIAAGNDFDAFGRGSVTSPGSAASAITAAAVSKTRVIAYFSSSGPTPISRRMKPDVSAPGVNILSSVPHGWAAFDGTSGSSPQVAGAAALLRERHPGWTVQQIKSALVQTGQPVYTSSSHATEVPSTREGGGFVDLPKADDPLVFASPTGLSFGLMRPGKSAARRVRLSDAGGGAGPWQVTIRSQGPAHVTAPSAVQVPGTVQVTAQAQSSQGEVTGFVVLKRGSESRRIPFWSRVETPRLGRHRHRALKKTGTYRGTTKGQRNLVSSYRYPDDPSGVGIPVNLAGPEQVFRVVLKKRVANFGVAILSHGRGVSIQPRVVAAGDENRLTGYPALPININPYLRSFFRAEPVAGAVLPAKGAYDIVFDTVSRAKAGRFTFRFWLNDSTRPSARLLTRSVGRTGTLRIRLKDRGAGIDPTSLVATVDGKNVQAAYSRRKKAATVSLGQLDGLARGKHRLVFQASDYQESRNMEDVGPILPNTRKLATTFKVR